MRISRANVFLGVRGAADRESAGEKLSTDVLTTSPFHVQLDLAFLVGETDTSVRLAGAWREEGLDSRALGRNVRAGELVRVRHGAYAGGLDEDDRLQHRQLIDATLPRLAPTGVLSHGSAAVLHGLPLWPELLKQVHITRPRTAGGRRSRYLHVHTGPLTAEDVTAVDGCLVTSLARTVADLSRALNLARAVSVADTGLRLGLARPALAYQTELARFRHGAKQLRFVTEFADPRSESPGESESRLLFHQLLLPPPEPQYKIVNPVTGIVIARCDFGWEEHRTVGEFDGRTKYGRLLRPDQDRGDVVFGEKSREDEIRELGNEVVRWTTPDLARPRVLRERILRAFARGDRFR